MTSNASRQLAVELAESLGMSSGHVRGYWDDMKKVADIFFLQNADDLKGMLYTVFVKCYADSASDALMVRLDYATENLIAYNETYASTLYFSLDGDELSDNESMIKRVLGIRDIINKLLYRA